MKFNFKALLAAAGVAAFAFSPAQAFEAGPSQTKSGSFIGASAGMPPPGIYSFEQVFTYQANFVGPNAPDHFGRQVNVAVQGFIFVPGWTFLGATYNFLVVQPFVSVGISDPAPLNISGVFNTYIVPIELSWTKIGGTDFAVKTGLGMYVPTGTISGPAGLNNVGSPYWTFQPELALSWLGGGWNLTAFSYVEVNTENTRTGYTSAPIYHVDWTATYTLGKWTFGPVGYWYAQLSDDKCPIGICTATFGLDSLATHTQRFSVAAIGGMLGYNFGPASASVWVTQDVYAKASNSLAAPAGLVDGSVIPRGLTVFGTLSYALWNPPAPAAPPMFHK
jgi:hypothetical protein